MTDAAPPPPGQRLLSIDKLCVSYGRSRVVDELDLTVDAGQVLGLVGESGCGKSVSMMAIMGLCDPPGVVSAQRLDFDGHDLLKCKARERRRIIGKEISIIFQEALTSLNPSLTVGYQIKEVLKLHEGLRGAALQQRALELLDLVGIADPQRRSGDYPHQMSGGMNQRVMIAMAVACNPKLLIADEPTTALDVTIQAQIMELLVSLQRERGMALVLISHDLALVSEVAQKVAVMYAGQIVEGAAADELFQRPHHPYTQALLECAPERNQRAQRFSCLPGMVPSMHERPAGCLFAPRCAFATDECRNHRPPLVALPAQTSGVDPTIGSGPWSGATLGPVPAGGSSTFEVRCFHPLGTQTARGQIQRASKPETVPPGSQAWAPEGPSP